MESVFTDVHCAKHTHFVEECAVCKQAQANFLPYPVRAIKPLPRAFGYTDNITEDKLRGPAHSRSRAGNSGSDEEFNLSLTAIRLLLKLIWPFGRIGP